MIRAALIGIGVCAGTGAQTMRFAPEQSPSLAPLRATITPPPPAQIPIPLSTSQTASTLGADLGSDRPAAAVKDAIGALLRLGQPASPELVLALYSPDREKRQRGAWVLQQQWDGWGGARDQGAFHQLLRVSIEGLCKDHLPRWDLRANALHDDADVFNASASVRFLARHVLAAEEMLVTAMGSDDVQQRFLAACVLAFSQRSAHTDRICQILIPHLRDNQIPGDGAWARLALRSLGDFARANILSALPVAVDAQQRTSLRLLERATRDSEGNVSTLSSGNQGVRASGVASGGLGTLGIDLDQLVIGWHIEMTLARRDEPSRPRPQTSARSVEQGPPEMLLRPRIYQGAERTKEQVGQ